MTKITSIPQALRRNFEEGKLRRNIPILLKVNCAARGAILSLDGQHQYSDLEFIPLRIDYSRSSYDYSEIGLLLAIAVNGVESPLSGNTKTKNKLPAGMSFYLMMNRNKSGTGPLDNYENMAIKIEQLTGIIPQGWIWQPSFEAKTGTIVENGVAKPIAYARCHWQVAPVENPTEQSFLEEIAHCLENGDDVFEAICPTNNKTLAKVDELAALGQLKRELDPQQELPQQANSGGLAIYK